MTHNALAISGAPLKDKKGIRVYCEPVWTPRNAHRLETLRFEALLSDAHLAEPRAEATNPKCCQLR